MNFNNLNLLECNQCTFGECIKLRREELGKSLRCTATELGISAAYLSDIERGNRNPPNNYLQRFISVLNIPNAQIDAFYALAYFCNSKGFSEYLESNSYAKKAILLAIKLNLSDSQWEEVISLIEKFE